MFWRGVMMKVTEGNTRGEVGMECNELLGDDEGEEVVAGK